MNLSHWAHRCCIGDPLLFWVTLIAVEFHSIKTDATCSRSARVELARIAGFCNPLSASPQ
jgi:hypothetical protein